MKANINYARQNLSGVGGWLNVLIFAFVVIAPLAMLGTMMNEHDTIVRNYPLLTSNIKMQSFMKVLWCIAIISVVASIVAGIRLWKVHSSKSVQIAIFILWMLGPFSVLAVSLVVLLFFGGAQFGAYLNQQIPQFIKAGILAGVGTAYLMLSVRVRNTYKE